MLKEMPFAWRNHNTQHNRNLCLTFGDVWPLWIIFRLHKQIVVFPFLNCNVCDYSLIAIKNVSMWENSVQSIKCLSQLFSFCIKKRSKSCLTPWPRRAESLLLILKENWNISFIKKKLFRRKKLFFDFFDVKNIFWWNNEDRQSFCWLMK